jgi:hypothetical protein
VLLKNLTVCNFLDGTKNDCKIVINFWDIFLRIQPFKRTNDWITVSQTSNLCRFLYIYIRYHNIYFYLSIENEKMMIMELPKRLETIEIHD